MNNKTAFHHGQPQSGSEFEFDESKLCQSIYMIIFVHCLYTAFPVTETLFTISRALVDPDN